MSAQSIATANEHALVQANDFIKANNKGRALNILRDLLSERCQWHSSLEQVMSLFASLCAENLDYQSLRDGIHHYKVSIMSQKEFSLAPLENIFKEITSPIEAKIDEMKESLDKTSALEEQSDLLTLIDPQQAVLHSYMKYLFEAYKSMIEVLTKPNKFEHGKFDHSKFDPTLLKISTQALNYCLKYQRKPDFMALTEQFRSSIEILFKSSSLDTVNTHIDIRFHQLSIAISLGLYNIAYKSIEDISVMIFSLLAKPKTVVLATYFQKLAQVYWITNAHLLHAYALYKHFFYNKNYNLNFSQEDTQLYSSVLLVAALSSPIQETNVNNSLLQFDSQSQRAMGLANLLSLPSIPKRETFLQEVRKVTNDVYPELSDLYSIFEKKTSPLMFAKLLEPKIKFIESHAQLSQYLKPFLRVVFTKIALQVSKVYEVIKIEEFIKLIPFYNKAQIELYLLEAIKRKLIGARIDHKVGVIRFGHYDFDSAKISDQLSNIASGVGKALKMVEPEKKEQQHNRVKKEIYVKIINSLNDEHRRILARKEIIEKKKIYMEQQERIRKQKEQEELQKKAQEKALRDQQRIQEDLERRELEQQQQQQQVSQLDQTINAVDKAKVEMKAKVAKISKQLYILERAYRKEELPVVNKLQEEKKVEDKEYFEKTQNDYLQTHKSIHDRNIAEKNRLNRIVSDYQSFTQHILEERKKQLPTLQAEQEKRFKEFLRQQEKEVAERKAEKEAARKAAAEAKAREEEERLRREEEERLRREKEEEEARNAPYVPPSRKVRGDMNDDDMGNRGSFGNDRRGGDRDNWGSSDDRRGSPFGGDRRGSPFGGDRDSDSWRRDDRPPRQQEFDRSGDRGSDNWRRDDRPPQRREGGAFGRDSGDSWKRDDAPPPRRDTGDNWRRDDAPPQRREGGAFGRDSGDSWKRDDAPPRRDTGDNWRRDDAPPPRRDTSDNWRRDDAPPQRREGGAFGNIRRDDERRGSGNAGGDNWRSNDRPSRPSDSNDSWRSNDKKDSKKEDDDGWQTVGAKKKSYK